MLILSHSIMTDEYRVIEPDGSVTKKEYGYYNGIPHEVLHKSQPEPKRDIIKDTLDLQRLILNPEDRPYIIAEKKQKQEQELIARSASKQIEKRLTAEQCIELQKKILDNEY